MSAIQIGWYNLSEGKSFMDYAEVASYDREVFVDAGLYPVVVYDLRNEKNGAVRGSAYVRMSGTSQSVYLHEIAHNIVDGGDRYELFPEYEARRVDFEYNGELCTTHCVFKKGA